MTTPEIDEPYYASKDAWFDTHWAAKVTPEFAVWWRGYYGTPDAYAETHEYFIRMAFALQGWSAREIAILEKLERTQRALYWEAQSDFSREEVALAKRYRIVFDHEHGLATVAPLPAQEVPNAAVS